MSACVNPIIYVFCNKQVSSDPAWIILMLIPVDIEFLGFRRVLIYLICTLFNPIV